jgi:hypothetical protein
MDLKCNASGDIVVENGDFVFVTGLDATIQFLGQRLRFFLSEWFLDQSLGIPYHDQVFVKNPNPVALDSIFKTAIIDTPGVLELQSFTMRIDAALRVVTITGRVRCIDGEADFSATQGA